MFFNLIFSRIQRRQVGFFYIITESTRLQLSRVFPIKSEHLLLGRKVVLPDKVLQKNSNMFSVFHYSIYCWVCTSCESTCLNLYKLWQICIIVQQTLTEGGNCNTSWTGYVLLWALCQRHCVAPTWSQSQHIIHCCATIKVQSTHITKNILHFNPLKQ